jgi:hypothetical protein
MAADNAGGWMAKLSRQQHSMSGVPAMLAPHTTRNGCMQGWLGV